MPTTLEDLESAALQLQPLARGELIRRLLLTLEPDQPLMELDDWTAAWADEAERRLQELESGKATALEGATTLQNWEKRYL